MCLSALLAARVEAASFPAAEWEDAPEAYAAAEAYAFGPGMKTDGVVIIRAGKLAYEKYRAPYTADGRHVAWSISKSFLNALVGVMVGEGKMALTDPVAKLVPALGRDEAHKALTIGHLMHMSSGLAWQESYEESPLNSSVLRMLYGEGQADMAAFVAAFALGSTPGTKWSYSSGDSNLLMGAVRQAAGEARYRTLPWTALFDRLGMRSAVWERDGHGGFVASSYVHATPRDLARFGYLFLRDGLWNGERILPEGWVAYSRTLAPAIKATPAEKQRYGAQWWLNSGEGDTVLYWPEAPADTYAAMGHWGQAIYVIPSLDIVVVRTADDRDESFSTSTFLKHVAAAVVGR